MNKSQDYRTAAMNQDLKIRGVHRQIGILLITLFETLSLRNVSIIWSRGTSRELSSMLEIFHVFVPFEVKGVVDLTPFFTLDLFYHDL